MEGTVKERMVRFWFQCFDSEKGTGVCLVLQCWCHTSFLRSGYTIMANLYCHLDNFLQVRKVNNDQPIQLP